MTTSGESCYRRLRGDIMTGALAPGQKLRLDRLKLDYGASISTLREVLNRLASEKFVLAEGQRGFEVAPVSAADLAELAALRVLLEAHAIRQSFAAGDLEWEGRVVAAHHKLALLEERRRAGDRADVASWKRYDWEFHQTLISACGSATLMQTHAGVFDKYLRYQMLALSDRGDIAVREHRLLMECALQRDADAAARVLEAHVKGGVAHALSAGTIR